ncbi:MAG: DUF1080 domain-containing protein [Opitutaceae bacterium]|nr:DUF1080 domain-containing protein [Opitutaceae bacterium]
MAQAAQPPAGFTALFNGRDLAGWRGGTTYDHRELLSLPAAERDALIAKWTASLTELKDGKPHWRAEGGALVNDGFGGYATTERDYGDFELRLEYKLAAGADSGVYLRGVPQVQIWDATMPDPKGHGYVKGSGGLWNNTKDTPGRDPMVRADRRIGDWNKLRVTMVGSRVSVWLNDKLVVDHVVLENYYDKANKKLAPGQRRPVPPKGPIQLQTHGGATHWRNIFIREIPGDEANKLLAGRNHKGFERIFNGQTLDGWAGATDAVEVKGGAMVWREKKGGVLYWNHDLADFQTRLQFKLPKAGNNGLAIRYPGTGDAAYMAMCELQILDDNYEQNKPAKIDLRQAHGSAYGMVAAARGYQRPLGEWNFEEVTVRGSTITVELNGTIILDTDLSKVDMSSVMGNKAHPGKDRKSGFFGFAGHNDPVQFREIAIKRL